MDGKHVLSKAKLPIIIASSVSSLSVCTKHVADVLPCFTVGKELGIEGKELCLGEKCRVGVSSKHFVPANDCLLAEAGVSQQEGHVLSAWPSLAFQLTHLLDFHLIHFSLDFQLFS